VAKDLTVILENRPGTLAELGEATGKAGINIEGACGFPCEGRGVIHLLVEDPAATRSALEGAGMEVSDERDVLVVDIEDRPGTMGDVCRRVADAGVNVDLMYATWSGVRLVIGGDDLDKAHAVL
jgi:hypothetical protein